MARTPRRFAMDTSECTLSPTWTIDFKSTRASRATASNNPPSCFDSPTSQDVNTVFWPKNPLSVSKSRTN